MNINDKSVLEMLNKFIAINRLNKTQILQMVNLVSISIDIIDLKENLKWESSKSFSKDKKTTYNYSNQEQVTYKKNYYQKSI